MALELIMPIRDKLAALAGTVAGGNLTPIFTQADRSGAKSHHTKFACCMLVAPSLPKASGGRLALRIECVWGVGGWGMVV